MTDQTAIAATQSVLDQLVAGTKARTAQKGTKLTPTRAERQLAPPGYKPFTEFPYDSPETMQAALRVALDEVDHVRKGLVAILAAIGGEVGPAETVDPTAAIKVAEKAADRAAAVRAEAKAYESEIGNEQHEFAVGFATQQAEAQAAAFNGAVQKALVDPKALRLAALRAELEGLG